ncbi:hypothetical protein MARPO_0010s0019 [Marchantia polymorpha]|uniref:NAD(P)H dehydrogenase (quinone) n=1 Tax=Marchantia polymorpha TaxID=3197 RepID=A0A2R6XKL6_MARPO|nr:hypothetical protein MARPO_0010s0019 [Marchantia polymorpha]|eukprot:PTQ46606.1 hypothetical protein MARPO_0010s0019 [Marchantia polymorpha]
MAIRAGLLARTGSAVGGIRRPDAIFSSAISASQASGHTFLRAGSGSIVRNVALGSVQSRRKVDVWEHICGTRANCSDYSASAASAGRRFPVGVRAMSSSAAGETEKLKIIGISGSFRKGSTNTGLLRAAVEIVEKDFSDVSLEIVEISNLPFVNTDLEVNGTYPESVTEFRAKVLSADGILFACPEYNYSVTGVLKNAVDWASRPPNVWGDKGAAIISSGGGNGGSRSSYHLRQTGVYIDLHFINKPEMFVKAFEPPQKFDQDGNLIDQKSKEYLKEVVKALRAWIIRLKR